MMLMRTSMTALSKRPPGRPKDEALQSRRQEEILAAATRVFAEHGYPSTDVQVIADRLGVGKGTVYRYFPSKRDLFLAAVDRGVRRLHERVEADTAAVADPIDRIVQAIHSYLAFFAENKELVELFIQERAEFKDRKQPAYFEQRDATCGPWDDLTRKLMAEGRVRDLPLDELRDVTSDLLYGTIFANHFARRDTPPRAQAEQVIDLIFHGILTDKERKRRGERARAHPPRESD
jgi:AcrR family transcriptional regulator